jgi:soluble lytic murein transglycosylase-like protein
VLIHLVIASMATASTISPEDRYDIEIESAVTEASRVYPVPKALVKAIISVESSFDPRAVSPTGAIGLMQILPRTARRLGVGVGQLHQPRENIRAGVRLLAILLRHYRGDIISTLVAYNARPRRLFDRIPQNGETPVYVRRVLARIRSFAPDAPASRPRADALGHAHVETRLGRFNRDSPSGPETRPLRARPARPSTRRALGSMGSRRRA